MIKCYTINSDFVNSRLDRWFRRNICEVPQSLIEKNLRKGKIKVNGKHIKSSYKLKINDKIEIFNITFNKKINKIERHYRPTKQDLSTSSDIFIENNDNFVVINKPAGISVQSGTKSKKNILDILKHTKEFIGSKPYAVHRIDKETSGILIVAKNRKFAQLFTTLFRIRKIHKTYLGIIFGNLNNVKGTLKDELYHYEGSKKIKNIAITHFKIIDSNNHYSFIKLIPETGRKHQLRKQLLIHGCPILGDSKYNLNFDKKHNKALMLHAHKISFSIDKIKYSFSSDLPDKFKKTLKEKYLKNFSQ